MRHFIFVVGPTASGKSDWAQAEAKKNQGVIFNCDSVQLYQEVNIGAAKPSWAERAEVPHHLFDVVEPPREITSAQYREIFLNEIKKISFNTPIYVVGGTGFYFLALEKGLYELTEPCAELKEQIENEAKSIEGIKKLFAEIEKLDFEYSKKLHLNDHYRIVRAIEILRSNPGKSVTQLIADKKEIQRLPGSIKKVGFKWEASALEKRIRVRTKKMLEAGLIDETKILLDEGLENWAPLKSVGYWQVVQYLRGKILYEDLEEKIVIATRQLAKKQRIWFQRDTEIEWIQYE